MLAVTAQGKRCGCDSLDRAERVALNAWNLHEPRRRVACHTEMIFQGNFGSVLDLGICAVQM